MKQWGKVLGMGLLTLGVVTLVGCKHMNSDNDQSQASDSSYTKKANETDGNGVQTAGVGNDDAFDDGTDMAGGPSYQGSGDPLDVKAIYFEFDGDTVRSEDLPVLKAYAQQLIDNPNSTITLAGNTDPRGSREYNIGLGWRRAQAVARILEMDGVSKSQIEMVSYGEERPAVLGTTETAYQKDRRTVLNYENSSNV